MLFSEIAYLDFWRSGLARFSIGSSLFQNQVTATTQCREILYRLFCSFRDTWPDYFVSGHDRAFPYASGQSWSQRLGETRLLVPGVLLSAPYPNHIKLDSESGESSWHTTSETWIPEDGLYDHLMLKIAKD